MLALPLSGEASIAFVNVPFIVKVAVVRVVSRTVSLLCNEFGRIVMLAEV
jgi:hypothetical protein